MRAGRELSSVLIIAPQKSGEQIAALLDRMEFYPIKILSNAGEARRLLMHDSFDIVIINAPLCDDEGHELALDIAESTNSGVMLAVRSEVYDETRYRVDGAGVFTLSKPLSPAMFRTGLALVSATRRRMAALEEENKKLHRKIDELRTIDRAKWVLVCENKMSEAEAHKYIEKGAMDNRMTRKDFAQSVLDEYD